MPSWLKKWWVLLIIGIVLGALVLFKPVSALWGKLKSLIPSRSAAPTSADDAALRAAGK